MIYTVTWRPVAEICLAELWTTSPHKGDIAKATDTIDYRLRHDPHNQGETRTSDAVRIVVVEPLAAIFEISEPDCHVTVLKIWRAKRAT